MSAVALGPVSTPALTAGPHRCVCRSGPVPVKGDLCGLHCGRTRMLFRTPAAHELPDLMLASLADYSLEALLNQGNSALKVRDNIMK